MSRAKFVTAADAFHDWRDDLLSGKPPTFYKVAESGPLARIEIGPKLITLVGGAPGSGKTALVMQCVFDALRLSPSLRAVVCNIEMPPDVLLERQLSRLSGVPLNVIRYRKFAKQHADRIDTGLATIEAIADRLCFVRPPFTLENVATSVDDFAPLSTGDGVLLVLDYVQRIMPPGIQGDKRGSVDAMMNYLRQFADAGAAVVAVSSVGRQKDNRGRSSYAGDAMSLASFKESGELEFGADDAFILTTANDDWTCRELKHLKSRHGEPKNLFFKFHGATQRFEAIDNESNGAGLASAFTEFDDCRGGDPWGE